MDLIMEKNRSCVKGRLNSETVAKLLIIAASPPPVVALLATDDYSSLQPRLLLTQILKLI